MLDQETYNREASQSYNIRNKLCFTLENQKHVSFFKNISQITSKCGKNKKVAQSSVSSMFLPHFDVCHLLLDRRTATCKTRISTTYIFISILNELTLQPISFVIKL